MIMMQRWKKLGVIFDPLKYGFTYAAVPVAMHTSGSVYRIFFSGRDSQNRSLPFFFDIDLKDISVRNIQSKPILELGSTGAFDDSGVMPSSIIQVGDKYHMYYIGWNLGVTVPFRNSIGLAVSLNGEHFKKLFEGPILERNESEPHFTASCCVLFDGLKWKMWYLSCVKWEMENNIPKHYYHIKYAESHDGIHWNREGIVAIDFKNKSEYAISVPRVIIEENKYRMWYSYRAGENSVNYRIGYAESSDGKIWERKDELINLFDDTETWDSDMQCYPEIVGHDNMKFLFYNGNGYGKTGIGLAVLEN